MSKRILQWILGCILVLSLCGCGADPELSKFKNDIDKMCDDLVSIDQKMNAIDAKSEKAVFELLSYLDELEMKFARFAELDFPEDYDYLEPVTVEARDYMKEAVKYFHESYKDNSYNEYTASYAQANYERAYTRIKVILSCLRGDNISTEATNQ